MSESDSNFFSRWSRRKAEVREGAAAAGPAAQPTPEPALVVAERQQTPATPPPQAAQAAPTLAEVDALTTESDYSRFVARDVAPEVKQAALKKLFTDPHFNIMDGLDTYIDDYGKPDPLPPGMLRKMMQSQLLGLFDHEKKTEPPGDAVAPADAPARGVNDELPPPPDTGTPGLADQPAQGDEAAAVPNPPDP